MGYRKGKFSRCEWVIWKDGCGVVWRGGRNRGKSVKKCRCSAVYTDQERKCGVFAVSFVKKSRGNGNLTLKVSNIRKKEKTWASGKGGQGGNAFHDLWVEESWHKKSQRTFLV